MKIGMRISVMPGARMLNMVTMKLIAPTGRDTGNLQTEVQKSMPWVGENGRERSART